MKVSNFLLEIQFIVSNLASPIFRHPVALIYNFSKGNLQCFSLLPGPTAWTYCLLLLLPQLLLLATAHMSWGCHVTYWNKHIRAKEHADVTLHVVQC